MPGRALKFHAFRFTVEGGGRFPSDMLRYDRCVPDRQEDVSAMVATERARQVQLVGYFPTDYIGTPTRDRWRSFGWTVVDGPYQLKQ